ncbi:MAG: ABC transporter permease [Desulfohalobiaceae bacterium]|nr:ABC transporter permease [Desulfohalobiaceae bacterium]
MKDFVKLLFSHGMGRMGIFIITLFLFASLFAPYLHTIDPHKSSSFENMLSPPSTQFWLGTDDLGRDIWSQIIYGSRISLTIGFVAAIVSVVFGTFVGLLGGFYGGIVDDVLSKIVDFFMMLPELPLMIILAAVLGPTIWNIIFVVSVVNWPTTARIVRSQVLSLKERPFIEASRSIGASDSFLMFKEILPNVVPLMFAQSVLMITLAIYAETILSFLGLGDPSLISWGQMLHFAFESGVMARSLWWVMPPIFAICSLIVSFTFLGTAITDVTNPGYKEARGL